MSTTPFLIVFANTRAFIRAREEIRTRGIPHQVQTTPRELYEQCGMCLSIVPQWRTEVEQVLPPTRSDLIYIDQP